MNYFMKARLAPTALAAPPILLMLNTLVDVQASQWMDTSSMLMLFGKGTLAAAITYFMVMINRTIAVEIFQRHIYRDELNFPTSRWLLASNNEMGAEYRQRIWQKVKEDFALDLPPATMGDSTEVLRHNSEVVGLIRQFVGNPPKLLRFNIEYGFFRNLIGASLPVLLAGAVNVYLNQIDLLPDWAFRLTVAYMIIAALLIGLSRQIIDRYGVYYARVLFQSYLDKKKTS